MGKALGVGIVTIVSLFLLIKEKPLGFPLMIFNFAVSYDYSLVLSISVPFHSSHLYILIVCRIFKYNVS